MNESDLLGYGLRCLGVPRVIGDLRFEAPVCMGSGSVFRGTCSIGAFTYMNNSNHFTMCSIGRYCSLGYDILVGPGQHEMGGLSTHPFISDAGDFAGLQGFESYRRIASKRPLAGDAGQRQTRFERPTRIGNDVWIGSRAIIMNGLTIGDGAVIGAGAVVTRDVAPYAVVVGTPARVVRKRFADELVAALLDLQWWQRDLSSLTDHADYADVPALVDLLRNETLPPFDPARFSLRPDALGLRVTPG